MIMRSIKVEKNLQRSNLIQYYDDEVQNINVCLQVLLHTSRILLVLYVGSHVRASVDQPVHGIKIKKK